MRLSRGVVTRIGALAAVALVAGSLAVSHNGSGQPTVVRPEPGEAILLAAGDIADCGSSGDEATAALLDAHPDATIAALGDTVYESGTTIEFANCYAASWGRHKARTRPAAGNHEYASGASDYFDYFGAAAGPRGKGWYSYDVGGWHVVVLNSNCAVVACGVGSEQLQWLQNDLAASDAYCTLGYWHHPRYSSGGVHGGSFLVDEFWKTLYAHGAELVLSGHDHHYERFTPMGLDDAIDYDFGIRQFVVGTGGKSLRAAGRAWPRSEVRHASTFGVLRLVLRGDGYDWTFLPQAGRTFTDSGTGSCHGVPDQ